MKKHTMRTLAMLLALIMLIGLLPAAALAVGDVPEKAEEKAEAIEKIDVAEKEKAEANGSLKIKVRIEVGSDAPRLKQQISEGGFSITLQISAVPEEGDTSLYKQIILTFDQFLDNDEDGIWECEKTYSNLPPINHRVSVKEDNSEVTGYTSNVTFDKADPSNSNCGFIKVESGETAEMTVTKSYQPAYGNLVVTKNFTLPADYTLSDFLRGQISDFQLQLYYDKDTEPMATVFVEDGKFASKEGELKQDGTGFVWTLNQKLIGNYYFEEAGADPREYDLDPFLPKEVVVEPGKTTETTLNNVYREPGSRVIITKELSGVDIDDLPEGAAIVLTAEESPAKADSTSRVLFSDFTEVEDGVYFYSLPAPEAGNYVVSEENVELDGYWLETDGTKTITVEDNQDETVWLNNTYTSKNGNLYVAKIIKGLPKDEELDLFPAGTTFRIEGPKEFNNGTGEMTVTFGDDFSQEYSTLDTHGGGIEGYTFLIKDVPPGIYTVTEDEDSASLEKLGYDLDVDYYSDTWFYTWKKGRGEDEEATQALENNQVWIGNMPGSHPYPENKNYGITVVDTYTGTGTLEITKIFDGLKDGVLPEEFALGLLPPLDLPGGDLPLQPLDEAERVEEAARKGADVRKDDEKLPYVYYDEKTGEFQLSENSNENIRLEQLVNEAGDIYGFIWTLSDFPTGTYYVGEDPGYGPFRLSGLDVDGEPVQVQPDHMPVMIGEIGLQANETRTLTVTNHYEPVYGYIRITKDLDRDSLPVDIPAGTTFTVKDADGNIAKDSDGNDAVLTYADIQKGDNLLELPAGIRYTIEETKAEVEGYAVTATYDLTDPYYIPPIKKSRENDNAESKRSVEIIIARTAPIWLQTSANDQTWAKENPVVFAFHNKYTNDFGTLTVKKIVKGLPDDLVADGAYTFKCEITPNGATSNKITVSTDEFKKNSDGDYEATVEVDLPYGSYQISEIDYDVDYYDVKVSYSVRSVTIGPVAAKDTEYTASATVTNEYTRRTSTINLVKRMAGVDPAILIEQGFGFEITGPEGFFPEDGSGKMTVLYAQMEEQDMEDEEAPSDIYGRRFSLTVPAGAYSVREINADVPGYTLYTESFYMQWAHAVIGPTDPPWEVEKGAKKADALRRGEAEAAEAAEATEDAALAEEEGSGTAAGGSQTQGDDPKLVEFEASWRMEDGTDVFFGNAYIKNAELTITKELGEGSEKVEIPQGTTFTVTDANGDTVKTVTYEEFKDGAVTVELPIGTYTVKEDEASALAGLGNYALDVAYETDAGEAKWQLTIEQEIINTPSNGNAYTYNDGYIAYKTTIRNDGGNPLYNVRIYDDLFDMDIQLGLMLPGMEIDLGENDYTIGPDDIAAGKVVRALTGEGFKSADASAEERVEAVPSVVTALTCELEEEEHPQKKRVGNAAGANEVADEAGNDEAENDGVQILVALDNNATVHVTNTYTANTTTVTVSKVWEDEDAPEGTRPDSVTVQLLANGQNCGDPVTLSADAAAEADDTGANTANGTAGADARREAANGADGWTCTWEKLPQNDKSGTAIEYTVEEVEVPANYVRTISGSAADGFTITNTYTPNTGTLRIVKTAKHESGADVSVPKDAKFTITGPDGYKEEVTYGQFQSGSYELKVPVGEYTVTEDKESASIELYWLEITGDNGVGKAVAKDATTTFEIENSYGGGIGGGGEPHLTVTKTTTAADGTVYTVGEEIKYVITVKNDGDLEITDIVVTDELTGDEWTIPSLEPGDSKSFEPTYTVTEADAEAGMVRNVATATGKVPGSDEPVMPEPGVKEDEVKKAHLTVEKQTTSQPANGSKYTPGETISYEITLTNDGKHEVIDIVVTDELTGNTWTVAALKPGEKSTVFKATYKVTDADAAAGMVINEATATGKIPDHEGTPVPVEPGKVKDDVTKSTTPTPPTPTPPGPVNPNPPVLNKKDHFAYIIGFTDGLVHPDYPITRAEVATIFFRLLTDESRASIWTQENDFSDVSINDWFNNAVSTMANGGILKGYPDGTFGPRLSISRAEFATIAVRFFQDLQVKVPHFTDTAGHWAEAYINMAADQGLINGYPDDTYRPDAPITRAEAMTIINRLLERHPHKNRLLDDMIWWPDNMNPGVWYYADVQEATNSHEYTMSGGYETWTELLPVRDWAAYETAWSTAYSARGGEVIGSDRYQSGNGNANGDSTGKQNVPAPSNNDNANGGGNEPAPSDNGGDNGNNEPAPSNNDNAGANGGKTANRNN